MDSVRARPALVAGRRETSTFDEVLAGWSAGTDLRGYDHPGTYFRDYPKLTDHGCYFNYLDHPTDNCFGRHCGCCTLPLTCIGHTCLHLLCTGYHEGTSSGGLVLLITCFGHHRFQAGIPLRQSRSHAPSLGYQFSGFTGGGHHGHHHTAFAGNTQFYVSRCRVDIPSRYTYSQAAGTLTPIVWIICHSHGAGTGVQYGYHGGGIIYQGFGGQYGVPHFQCVQCAHGTNGHVLAAMATVIGAG
mmetsp:Transcript_6441/g.18393  ORF Transcript_6441/g.18393 Transcript_6441/m.18393 type:complete len:243 (+) Transcript_6441:89-817(+)